MSTILTKAQLREGRYYSGYEHQHYCCVSKDQPVYVAQWNSKTNSFWYLKTVGAIQVKEQLPHISDIDNEIELGFMPLNEVIPNEEAIID